MEDRNRAAIARIESGPQASQAVIHNGIAHIVGVICPDGALDAYGQAQFILRRIDGLLAQAGTDKTRLVRGWLIVLGKRLAPEPPAPKPVSQEDNLFKIGWGPRAPR